ncbi:glycoside hydrolase family 18 chitinase [Actinocorallia sp. API 0066]|uniref:glycosyl hydrolase family 18 protein n=1 Tax=Actinocorallia sp. API 0066 TaxID=2896846 RepID=UPI001E61BFEC|nr:glycosyl hydrolase family 18 protein [Actinocorallia sp. API 0066]MCD0447842.1 glycoside hydrolase family 18 chitinase [Actinocorallia sp. API 0066]
MRRLTTFLAMAALCVPFLAAVPASADTPSTATYAPQGDWGSGFQGSYTVKAGSAGLANWKLEFDLPAGVSLSSVWDADYTRSGQRYTFTGKSWNANLAPGASVSPGFVGAPGGGVVPANCKLNGNPCDGGTVPGDARPTAPTGLAATTVTEDSVTLSWQPGTDDNGVTGYHVYRGTTKAATVSGTTATVTGLAPNTAYTFTVRTVDTADQESDASAPLTVTTSAIDDTTAPSVPAGLTATATSSSAITLTWTASTDNVGVTGYDVYRGTTNVGTATGTTYTDSGLAAETSYTYTVRAKDAAGNTSGPSNTATATTKATDPPPGDYEKIGYFAQWGVYGRNFHVKDVHTSGAAENLTTINYAFANVNADGRCFMVNALGSGDAYADYQKSYNAAASVDGVADRWDDPLRGNFGQLKRLKAMYPGLKVYLSLGGWTWSKYFSNAAVSDTARKAHVASCIDLFIKGNLPLGDGAGGPGAAKGVFDGIDIDWEWPGSSGEVGNVIRPEDKQNLTALLREWRTQLDVQGAADGKRYGLTMFMPADPEKVAAGIEIPQVSQILDWGNLQGYDLHGAWEGTTNHQSNLYDVPGDPGTPKRYSVDSSLQVYLDGGWPAAKMTIGIPMYARGWKGVPAGGTNGLWQQGNGGAQGVWEVGIDDYKVVKNKPGTVHRDDAHGAVWKYDGNTWWTYDDPALVAQKARYVKDRGLLGAMFWELDGDDADASLSTAAANVLK